MGDDEAPGNLPPLVYDQFPRLAVQKLASEGPGQTSNRLPGPRNVPQTDCSRYSTNPGRGGAISLRLRPCAASLSIAPAAKAELVKLRYYSRDAQCVFLSCLR